VADIRVVLVTHPRPSVTAWTEADRALLSLHTEFLGPQFDLIAQSMHRTRSSVELHFVLQQRDVEQARRDLGRIAEALESLPA
jgi:hypothetical protein|tara:strand:+ start:1962 stop:2210 length:249 start_codon:yes stop_codon:yes gene_type:complete